MTLANVEGSRSVSDAGEVRPKIGLTLSGGGTRAAVFHLGVLRRLAEDDRLEDVSAISTVSGGSLVTAAVFAHSSMTWPTSARFLSHTYPNLRHLLTSTDLMSYSALGWRRGLLRHNTRILMDRAAVLADLLEERWKVSKTLRDLPDNPTWSINTTCIETGKNWRFSKREMGDWTFGRHYNPSFKIAQAAAASAAVPYGIGALRLNLPKEGWKRTDPATRRPVGDQKLSTSVVNLWDGGAYENLGLEVLFKPGEPLRGCDYLICSDASGPLRPPKAAFKTLMQGDLWSPRLFDVASDQLRSLRSRMLVRELGAGTIRGVLIRMGNSRRDLDITTGIVRDPMEYDCYLSDEESRLALAHPTNLKALSDDLFDRLARHGFEIANATLNVHGEPQFAKDMSFEQIDARFA